MASPSFLPPIPCGLDPLYPCYLEAVTAMYRAGMSKDSINEAVNIYIKQGEDFPRCVRMLARLGPDHLSMYIEAADAVGQGAYSEAPVELPFRYPFESIENSPISSDPSYFDLAGLSNQELDGDGFEHLSPRLNPDDEQRRLPTEAAYRNDQPLQHSHPSNVNGHKLLRNLKKKPQTQPFEDSIPTRPPSPPPNTYPRTESFADIPAGELPITSVAANKRRVFQSRVCPGLDGFCAAKRTVWAYEKPFASHYRMHHLPVLPEDSLGYTCCGQLFDKDGSDLIKHIWNGNTPNPDSNTLSAVDNKCTPGLVGDSIFPKGDSHIGGPTN